MSTTPSMSTVHFGAAMITIQTREGSPHRMMPQSKPRSEDARPHSHQAGKPSPAPLQSSSSSAGVPPTLRQLTLAPPPSGGRSAAGSPAGCFIHPVQHHHLSPALSPSGGRSAAGSPAGGFIPPVPSSLPVVLYHRSIGSPAGCFIHQERTTEPPFVRNAGDPHGKR
jgi:hypothetical protein